MALNDMNSGNGFYMPVAPAYGGGYGGYGGGFGLNGDLSYLLLFMILLGGGMWGGLGGFGGGMMWPMMMGGMGAGFGLDYLYPWLNNSQHISDGFRDQQLNIQIGDMRSDVNRGFGDVQLGIAGLGRQICETGNGITQQLYTNQIADLERSFAAQTASAQGMNAIQGQLAQCCCDNRLATCQTQNVVQSEAAATRASASADTQKILDKLCQLELDGVRSDLEAERRSNIELQNRLNMANLAASQAAQTATFQQGLNNEVDALYNRLKNCPVGTYSVCNPYIYPGQNVGCGCGCGCGAN